MEVKVIDIVRDNQADVSLPHPVPDPLVESTGLHEATLLNMVYDVLSLSFAILFDLRTSMYFEAHHTNTGLLILRGVSALVLSPRKDKGRKVWLVDDVIVTPKNFGIGINLDDIISEQSVAVETRVAQFMTGFVEGLGEVAAELDDDQTRAYFQTTPSWESSIDLRGFTSRNAWEWLYKVGTSHAATENSGTISLVAGQTYTIRLDYYDATGLAQIKLSWLPPGAGGVKGVIPAANLLPPVSPTIPVDRLTYLHSDHLGSVSATTPNPGSGGGAD